MSEEKTPEEEVEVVNEEADVTLAKVTEAEEPRQSRPNF